MEDQAQGLRALARKTNTGAILEPSNRAQSPSHRARTIAVTSGKGGVGKTNLCANLALTLAKNGLSVILLDADLGLANVHVMLGSNPRYTLEHVLRGEKSLQDILHPGPFGIQVIGGGSGITELANLSDAQREKFIQGLACLDMLADIILIDTGAGLSKNVMGFVLAAEEVILITTPEPTAIADAYATIKVVSQENPDVRFKLVVNMASSETDALRTTDRLRMVTKQFLHIDLKAFPYIPADSAVANAIRSQKPLMIAQPGAPAAKAIAKIAHQLGYGDRPARGAERFLSHLSRYFKRTAEEG